MDDAWRTLIFEAVRFSVWAAGEGLAPAREENAEAPEEFLFQFSQKTKFADWDDLASEVERLLKREQ